MNALRRLSHDILLVWTFFTRIPAPHFVTTRTLAQALWALPLAGLVVAACQLLVYFLILLMPEQMGLVAPIFMIAASILITGALHWDGLADFCDGLGVGRDRRAQVMRDSALGTFGALGLLILFSTQVWILHGLQGQSPGKTLIFFALIALGSRGFMALLWATIPSADSASQARRLGTPSPLPHLFILLLLSGLLLWFGWMSFLGLVLLICCLLAWALFVWNSQAGINGDALGASQVVAETLILLFLLVA